MLSYTNTCSVDCDDMEAAEEYTILKPAPASSEFVELADFVMTEDEIEVLTNADEGLLLYKQLKTLLE